MGENGFIRGFSRGLLYPRDPNTKTKKVGTFGVFLEGYLLRRLPLDP